MKRLLISFKRILTFVITFVFINVILAVLGINVYAMDSKYVASVSNVKYETYQEAWNMVSDGGTIDMLKDWEIDGLLTINDSKEVTINMNGHMIDRNLDNPKGSGEIFLLKPNAILNINGNDNTTIHHGTINNGIWYHQGEGNGNYAINGALITGGNNSNGGSAIHVQANAKLNVTGVTIAGNVCTDDEMGGAIRLQGENSVLNLVDSNLSYNKSEKGGGAAIWVQGVDSQVLIKDSIIEHNMVDIYYGDGGAIQINNGTVKIENSRLCFNETLGKGGAIYIYNGNLILDENTIIDHNQSKTDEGGAIYVDKKADNVEIRGTIYGNTAKYHGGGIYVNSDIDTSDGANRGVKIIGAEIYGNTALNGEGGGVYVDDDNNISLSGATSIDGNSPNSLAIYGNSAIKENKLEENSKIGLFTSWTADKDDAVKTNCKYFYSDKIGYEIAGDEAKLYFIKSAKGAPKTYTVGNQEYDLIKSTFSYTAMAGGTMSPSFYYSDGYFASQPKYYNDHLASLTCGLALAAMQAKYEGDYTEDKGAKNIINMFTAMGYSNIMVHFPYPKYYGAESENLSTIGYAIASKKITVNGVEKTIIATAVRGGGYGAEWASNVTLGSGVGEAQGFSDAAGQVKLGIDQYLSKYEIDTSKANFLITGYSRAAATSNLVAKRLTDIYGEDNVYAYCFETPMGGVPSEMNDDQLYYNIHNIINPSDIVPMVGTVQMGFIRYGVDHMIPTYNIKYDFDDGSWFVFNPYMPYKDLKKLMLAQLKAINPNIEFNDDYSVYTISYVLGSLGLYDMINVEYTYRGSDYATHLFIASFIEKLQKYSLTNEIDGSIYNDNSNNWYGYRNYWSDYEWYLYEDTNGNLNIKDYANKPSDFDTVDYRVLSIEDSIANLMDFYFGSSDEKKEKIMNALDVDSLMGKVNVQSIYFDLIGEWQDFEISEKNKQFNKLFNALDLKTALNGVLNEDEFNSLKCSLFVILDFLLDFVGEDYNLENQNYIATLVANVDSIMQSHYQDVTYSWVRIYDSFYSDLSFVCEHNHGDAVVVKEATVTEYGVSVKVCSICGEEVYEAIPRLECEHRYGEGVVVIEATDTQAGVIEKECEICGHKEMEAIEALAPQNTGSLVGNGSIIAIVILSSILVIGAVAVFIVMKKKSIIK